MFQERDEISLNIDGGDTIKGEFHSIAAHANGLYVRAIVDAMGDLLRSSLIAISAITEISTCVRLDERMGAPAKNRFPEELYLDNGEQITFKLHGQSKTRPGVFLGVVVFACEKFFMVCEPVPGDEVRYTLIAPRAIAMIQGAAKYRKGVPAQHD